MKIALSAKPLLTGAFWSALFLTLFSAPVIMAARVADDDRTADLIRQHQEALSPWPSAAPALPQSSACEQGADAMEQETALEEDAAPDAPIIRAVGKRGHRIEV